MSLSRSATNVTIAAEASTSLARSAVSVQRDRCNNARHAANPSPVTSSGWRTYLGHTDIVHTYWYLEATLELMTDIATAAEALIAGGNNP